MANKSGFDGAGEEEVAGAFCLLVNLRLKGLFSFAWLVSSETP